MELIEKSTRTITLILCIFFLPILATEVPGQGVDFRDLEPGEQTGPKRLNLLEQRHVIWEDQAEDLVAEIATLKRQLLWVSATSRRLHVSHGNRLSLYPGQIEKRISGKILALDVHPLPNLREQVLISVNYLKGDELRTEILTYHASQQKLQSVHSQSEAALRPLGAFLYGQKYGQVRNWDSDIHRIKTAQGKFSWESTVPFPDHTRLLQMTSVFDDVFVSLNSAGNLVIHRKQTVHDVVEGPFGASTRALPSKAPRQQQNRDTVRIAPTWLDNRNLVAVARNPQLKRGLLEFIGQGEQSFIEFFRWNSRAQRLEKASQIGPMNGRILDTMVSQENPDQFLWIRKNANGMVKLELIDFGELTS